jgi:hypothetical protein
MPLPLCAALIIGCLAALFCLLPDFDSFDG